MKILITDSATVTVDNDVNLDVFEQFGEVVKYDNISCEDLFKEVVDCDVVLSNKVVIDRAVMQKAQKLKYIGLFATGYNNIDINAAHEYGITVCNTAGYSTNAVAQQVIAYILMHYTRVNEYNTFVKQGGWKESKLFSPLVFPTDEVYGKTLGIIGYGDIGKAVEKAALGLGMNVIVYTRTIKENGVTKFVNFDELLQSSDVVSVHCPLTDKTADLMNKNAFKKMKDGAFFINTSRGGVVEEQALADALDSGKLSGAAVDVLKSEPMSADCVLHNAKNITITPHTAWAPLSTRQRLLDLVVKNLSNFLNGEKVKNLAE